MPKTYIFHDGKMWSRTAYTKEQLLAAKAPLSTPIIEVGGSGEHTTLGALFQPLGAADISPARSKRQPAPPPAAAPDVNAQQLAVLRDIASNVRVLTWLAIIPWIVALAGLVLWFLAR